MGKNPEQGKGIVSMMTALLLGGSISLLSALLLLFLSAAAISGGILPQSWEQRVVIGVTVAGALAGGWLAARRWEEKRLIAGVLTGVIFFLLLMTIALIFFSSFDLNQNGVGTLAGCLCGGGIAGVLSRGKRKGKKRRKRS